MVFSVVWEFLSSVVVVVVFLGYSALYQNSTTVPKEIFFPREISLVREGHKGIKKTILKSSRMTTDQYINIGIHNVNQENKTRQHEG